MTNRQSTNKQRLLIFLMMLPLLLAAGCAGMAFSPEEAAMRSLTDRHSSRMTVDPASIQVLQKVQLDDDTVLVMAIFQEMNSSLGLMFCESVSEMRKTRLQMWVSGSGGSVCSTQAPDVREQPVTINGNNSGGGFSQPDDPGYSSVYGLVLQDEIKTILVHWNDEVTTEAEVINDSYLAVRSGGGFQEKLVEGLNADGEVVYTQPRDVAPEKIKEP